MQGNLFFCWQEFFRNKKKRKDVAEFLVSFYDNIATLREDLENKTYKHGGYELRKINDPKPREIHKASVRDRLVHHMIYNGLYSHFDKKFIFDSYSCRFGKGTHRAVNRFRQFGRIVSQNHSKQCWVLKCDIKKFFANIDHAILKNILEENIADPDIIWLLGEVVDSFYTKDKFGVGLPLGNLTSQLLVNIYMNKFDQFVKRKLKARFYIRYADDFVILSRDKKYLYELIPQIANFLEENLKLQLHPNKVFIKTFYSGVDFLGWVNFSHNRVLRTSTKKRMFRNLKLKEGNENTVASYLGMLKHGNAFKLSEEVKLNLPNQSRGEVRLGR